jgi:hypothetical protein
LEASSALPKDGDDFVSISRLLGDQLQEQHFEGASFEFFIHR